MPRSLTKSPINWEISRKSPENPQGSFKPLIAAAARHCAQVSGDPPPEFRTEVALEAEINRLLVQGT